MLKKYLPSYNNTVTETIKPILLGLYIHRIVAVAILCALFVSNTSIHPVFAFQAPIGLNDILDHPNRLTGDRQRDTFRRPGEILGLMGISSGATVLDIFSGSGYYTELLSHIVGPSGTVIHHNNDAFASSLDVVLRQRFANNRLPNVERVTEDLNDLSLKPNSLDAALLALTYHDFYFESPSWPGIDEKVFLARLYQAIKPGGVVGLIDHAAKSGAGVSDASRLHRIEKSHVIFDFQSAGFYLMAQSDHLSNEVDDHTLSVFDPVIRSKTDRFILVFRRPL